MVVLKAFQALFRGNWEEKKSKSKVMKVNYKGTKRSMNKFLLKTFGFVGARY